MKTKYLYRDKDHFHTPKHKYNRAEEKRNLFEEIIEELEANYENKIKPTNHK